jgi:octanoyl-[GcvH]:protein N-octanoyltransferase
MKEAVSGPFHVIDDTVLPSGLWPSPNEYAEWIRSTLGTLKLGDAAILRLRRPQPTAAFSPQDTTHPDYERIKELARARGFEPIERGTGGRLTMFDENALAITLIMPHEEPHTNTIRRYEVFSSIIAEALKSLGIDARVGELPNEYCPGKYSINANGRVKLVGIAQRMNRHCVQMGAIITVNSSEKARLALAEAYGAMGLSFDPATYGSATGLVPSITYEMVQREVQRALMVHLSSTN